VLRAAGGRAPPPHPRPPHTQPQKNKNIYSGITAVVQLELELWASGASSGCIRVCVACAQMPPDCKPGCGQWGSMTAWSSTAVTRMRSPGPCHAPVPGRGGSGKPPTDGIWVSSLQSRDETAASAEEVHPARCVLLPKALQQFTDLARTVVRYSRVGLSCIYS
jgi:hypothetical protein